MTLIVKVTCGKSSLGHGDKARGLTEMSHISECELSKHPFPGKTEIGVHECMRAWSLHSLQWFNCIASSFWVYKLFQISAMPGWSTLFKCRPWSHPEIVYKCQILSRSQFKWLLWIEIFFSLWKYPPKRSASAHHSLKFQWESPSKYHC